MIGLAYSEVKTLSHQGKELRLSLPRNDHRNSHDYTEKEDLHYNHWKNASINLEYEAQLQTVDLTTLESYDDDDMRVVCSVADRTQWEQHLRAMRETRLAAMGVGIDGKCSAYPINKPNFGADRLNWTGLHTPATSTNSIESNMEFQNLTHSALDPASIAAQVAVLQARQAVIEKDIAGSEVLKHMRSLSQRELVHKRLSSLPPVIVRNSSRVVSAIESIPEEAEAESPQSNITPEEGADILIALGNTSKQGPTANGMSLHQHLASHDMKELIPPMNNTYQSFAWGDEPMDGEGDYAHDFVDYNYSSDYGSWPPVLHPAIPELGPVNPYAAAIMQPPQYANGHTAHLSSFNLGAQEYVPISQAIVRPTTASRAIPIVRPPGTSADEIVDDTLSREDFEIDEAYVSDGRETSTEGIRIVFDAYEGFDSGTDSSVTESLGDQPADQVNINCEDTPDEVRVKSFRFPSALSAPVTPSRPRTDLFDSASPDDQKHKKALSFTLTPPKKMSTPKKSPRVFNKSVALPDTELDAIIMDLSIRELPTEHSQSDLED